MSITERAVASRALPSAFMTNMYGTKPERPGVPGGLPTGAGVTSGSSSTVETCAPLGAISAITSMPAARQLSGETAAPAVEHVRVGGVHRGQPLLAGPVRRGLADVRPAAVHKRVRRRACGAGSKGRDGDRGDGCGPAGDHRRESPTPPAAAKRGECAIYA
jgi:hypothetical protein